MRGQSNSHGNDRNDAGDPPAVRGKARKIDHAPYYWDHRGIHPLETLDNLGHFLEEVRVFFFLGGGAPRHLDLEHMRQNRNAEMERQAAEEDGHQWQPLEVLKE